MIKKKTVFDILLFLTLFYVLALVALYFVQRSIIYVPTWERPEAPQGIEIAKVTTSDGLNIQGWFTPAQSKDKPTIILFHGNAGHHGHRDFYLKFFSDLGYGFLIAGYRGYGGNEGKPSEQGLYNDGRAYIDWLKTEQGIGADNLIIMGESIGSGTAVQMARENQAKALVLVTPFYSLYRVAKEKYAIFPVQHVLKDHYLNNEKITDIHAPLLILHGHQDDVIPYNHATELFEIANEPKQFKDFPQAKHNNIFSFGAIHEIQDFLAGLETDNTDN